ncbi:MULTISPECIES: DVUA0089 family protein [Methylomonas]|uniref:DVUA0089 family protein n=1 Tax=Methylomonas TaxID=416 RepID=UPI001231C6D1|nr:DVUA0089 family protein [Methylomonas rhizoryzae]
MNFSKALLALAVGLGVASSSAQAALEDLGTDNSSVATAQYVGTLTGADPVINVLGVRGSVYGGLIVDNDDVDFYSFDITAPTWLKLTVTTPDGPLFGDDPIVGLFDTSGSLVAYDDDAGPGFDAFLVWEITEPGTYTAAVAGYDDFGFESLAGVSTDFFYTLQIDIAAVPVPAAVWLMGSALLGLGLTGKKRSA